MIYLIVIFGIFFCIIDIMYFKPETFPQYPLANLILLTHHFVGIYVILGAITTLISPKLFYFLFIGCIVILWQVFDNNCILSILTKQSGPKEDYCPFVSPWNLPFFLINHENLEKYIQK